MPRKPRENQGGGARGLNRGSATRSRQGLGVLGDVVIFMHSIQEEPLGNLFGCARTADHLETDQALPEYAIDVADRSMLCRQNKKVWIIEIDVEAV